MISNKRENALATERHVAAYVRISNSGQRAEGDSVEAQRNAITRNLTGWEQMKGWKIASVRFYIEAGGSDDDQNRPELQRLQADIAKGEIDTVVCCKLDRITRSILDLSDLWEFFSRHAVEFISLRENVDTTTATGKALLMILSIFAQLEREGVQ